MDINTVFGITWHVASGAEYAYIIIFIIVIMAVVAILRYRSFLQNRRLHEYHLFLYKLKRLGLSNFQIKIINNITEILMLDDKNKLLDNPEFFENAIGKLLLFLKDKGEMEESRNAICKDIAVTYEKLYHHQIKKPLDTLHDIDISQLVCLTTEDKETYLGKVINKDISRVSILLFNSSGRLLSSSEPHDVSACIWRVGDAEYEFKSTSKRSGGNVVAVDIPDEFKRGNEFRHQYLDVIIQATLELTDLNNVINEQEQIHGTVLKLNEYELVMRTNRKLDFKNRYTISFTILDFTCAVVSRIISNKTIEEGALFYYSFKFDEMSDIAKNVLKKFIYDHL